MCERDGRWDHGDGWWRGSPGSQVTQGVAQPQTGLQADGNKDQAERPRVLGPDGNPVPRRVHRVGFHPEMVTD
jgi:hypothetical protein